MRGPFDTPITVNHAPSGCGPLRSQDEPRPSSRFQSVRVRTWKGTSATIRITSFNEQTQPTLENALRDIKTKLNNKVKGYVLDLRNNPGGLLDQAVSVRIHSWNGARSSRTRTRRPEDTQRFNAKPGDMAEGKPIVVLINDGTRLGLRDRGGRASGSTPRHRPRTKSFGKGSVADHHSTRPRGTCHAPDHGALLPRRAAGRSRRWASRRTSKCGQRK